METVRNRPATSWTSLFIVILLSGIFGWYIIFTGREITLRYDQIDKLALATFDTETDQVEIPKNEAPLFIPNFKIFTDGQPWMYISSTRPIAADYNPNELITIDIPHGDSNEPMKLDKQAASQLQKLFKRASNDGIDLMVSSAYRSVADQTQLYDAFVAKQGQASANQYVAKPGASEHHSGLAVDITDASSGCSSDSDRCNLSPATAAWLADIAPEYGFIIRYPSGKQPVTGTAYEPWHLRYVGVALARQLTISGLTLDEFIDQVAPGRLVISNRN